MEGEKYWSENVTTVEVGSTSRDLAEEVVRRYPKGSKVDVYVDPKDPTMAVLERGSSAGALFVAIGVLFTLSGGLRPALHAGLSALSAASNEAPFAAFTSEGRRARRRFSRGSPRRG